MISTVAVAMSRSFLPADAAEAAVRTARTPTNVPRRPLILSDTTRVVIDHSSERGVP
jgi:hypothetical protein